MALEFIGIDPSTNDGNCPAAWVDKANADLLFQGWKPDEETEEECRANSPRPDHEAVVRVPVRMVPIIRKACDEAERRAQLLGAADQREALGDSP
ncbi:hypothetical protein [Streptomyces hiroshimensis]|uniref:hypothetical protein n=1 Tax=Streptomyces hiroshimensis TaxID=66424 RepID=UPI001E2B7F1B|nr:hypothetical protein [Streptomyces hiroshimensis]